MPRFKNKDISTKNFIKFLGTAGARFVMIKQLRASGGIWVHFKETDILIDPGPGSIVHCAKSRPRLDPTKLEAVILTHRHLDHSNDINVIIESMTEGGFKKRAAVLLPSDAVNSDTVILSHAKDYIKDLIILNEGKTYKVKDIEFNVAKKMVHPVLTYGLKFNFSGLTVSFIADTEYFDDIAKYFKADVLIINVVFFEKRPGVLHLCLDEAKKIIKEIRPKSAILTHFGMSMLKNKPNLLAEGLTKDLGIEVIAAYDGMVFRI